MLQALPRLVKRFFGKLFGGKGYLSQALFEQLLAQGIQPITRLMPLSDKLLLRKRAIIETINDYSRTSPRSSIPAIAARSIFLSNLLCGLIARCHQPKKPSLHLDRDCRLEAVSDP